MSAHVRLAGDVRHITILLHNGAAVAFFCTSSPA